MDPLSKSLLLFAMNWLDAQLTLVWVRMNVATEANGLMARLLKHSEFSFLAVKLIIGAFAAYTLYRCSHLPLARKGMTFVLGIYAGLMLVHAATGCIALGWLAPVNLVEHLSNLPVNMLGIAPSISHFSR
ncbi:MAG: hypothetical protein C5B55_09085 [Blastocatellia bacterium]|nr:MAG: hypothetical protein C5B55_09085 [Blastocatellia bacterium]